MNQNYIHTLTLYSRIRAAETKDRKERWVRTVLHNCFWKSQIKTVYGDVKASAQNVYVVRIPVDSRYLPYAEFAQNPVGMFSISQGDLVILGECNEEITGESGYTAAQILNRHKPNAFQVTAFSDNTAFPVAKHYRLGG